MSVIKRFFFYLVSFISLGMLATGVGNIIRLITDSLMNLSSTQIGRQSFSASSFSLGLALIIIGGVLWFFFWKYIQKNAAANGEETGSAIRAWYLNLVLLISLVFVITSATELISWLIGNLQRINFPLQMPANLIVGSVVWYYHRYIQEKEGQPSSVSRTLRRWYTYIFSAWGLIFLSIGLVQLIYHAVVWLPIWGTSIQSGSINGSPFGSDGAFIIVGGFVWWLHWFKLARKDIYSTLRQVYLYLLTILGSVIAGLTALTFTLNGILRHIFGVNVASGAYFQFLGWTIPLMVIAVGIWTFHRQVAQEEAVKMPELLSSARRVYSYLMSLVGLGSLVAGLVVLLGLLLRLLVSTMSSSTIAGTDNGFWQTYLSISLSLLIVGVPMWFYYWNKVVKMVAGNETIERRAVTRRIYLYFILAATIIASATGLSNVIYQFLNGIFQGNFGAEAFRRSIWGLQALLVALPFLLYHLGALRTDQKSGAETTAIKRKQIILIAVKNNTGPLVSKIEDKFGTKARVWYYQEQSGEVIPALSDSDIGNLLGEIEAVPDGKILITHTSKGLQVFPYEDK